MNPIEYVAPSGAVQMVDTPVVAERLRARGWRPRPELETMAAANDAAATAHLEREREFRRERASEQREREARVSPASERGTPPADRGPQDRKPAAKRRAAAEADAGA